MARACVLGTAMSLASLSEWAVMFATVLSCALLCDRNPTVAVLRAPSCMLCFCIHPGVLG
eukprot:scaffold97704_cov29-Tisochrysis_lutea.AAC.1